MYLFPAVLYSRFSLVQFSRSVVSDSLRPHELQHPRLPCPSPTPRVHPNSYPLTPWCHPTISSSTVPFSSHPQSFPASGSFPMSWLFASGGQVLEFQPQRQSFQWIFSLFPLGLTGLISLLSDVKWQGKTYLRNFQWILVLVTIRCYLRGVQLPIRSLARFWSPRK